MTPRERILRIVVKILANPYHFTRKDLANEFNEGRLDAIHGDIREIKYADIGFHQEEKPPYRLAIVPDHRLRELKHLIPFTEDDRATIRRVFNQYLNERDALYLNNKLSSLYDFQKLGLHALRRPMLERIDRLEAAKIQELQVTIENYRSNSNSIRDRHVEPFHIDPELDTVQAFDIDKQQSLHFRLSRIDRVLLSDQTWQFKDRHQYKYTDVFRIADDQKELVQLQLNVWAYNALIEAYPKARAEVLPGATPNTFDFQSKVNHQFLGLLPFIMANAPHVQIIYPARLKERVREEAEKIVKNLEGMG